MATFWILVFLYWLTVTKRRQWLVRHCRASDVCERAGMRDTSKREGGRYPRHLRLLESLPAASREFKTMIASLLLTGALTQPRRLLARRLRRLCPSLHDIAAVLGIAALVAGFIVGVVAHAGLRGS